MTVTLYPIGLPPRLLPAEGFLLPNPPGYAHVSEHIAEVLGCSLGLVDVLDMGNDFVAYSIFDCEADLNRPAMQALAAISDHSYDPENEDEQLRGPILIVSRD